MTILLQCGKSLYCIHDQNKLSRDANGQSWKPTALLLHETFGNRRAFQKIAHRYLELVVSRNKYFFEIRFVSRNIRSQK